MYYLASSPRTFVLWSSLHPANYGGVTHESVVSDDFPF